MALSNDWEWIVILSIYAVLLGLSVVAYNVSFNPDGSVKGVNTNTSFGNQTTGYITSNADTSTSGLSFISSLSFGMPPGIGAVFITLFEILPGGLLAILVFRQFRGGNG